MRKEWGYGLILAAFFILFASGAAAHELISAQVQDRFVPGDAVVVSDQTVGRFLVVQGNALVEGTVARWLVVLEGNLTVAPGGRVLGDTLVLGGRITSPAGAFAKAVYALPQPPVSILALIFGTFVVLMAVLIILTIRVWRWAARFFWQVVNDRLPNRQVLLYGRYLPLPPLVVILCGLLASVVSLVLFIELAEDTILQHEMDFFDQLVIWLTRYFASPRLDQWAMTVTRAGSGFFYGLTVPFVALFLLWRRQRRQTYALLACLGGAVLLNDVLKNLFARTRPDMFRLVDAAGYSFPSGHAMVSLCFYGMIAYLIGQLLQAGGKQRFLRTALYAVATVLVACIGLSRIYLGVHYPSDVVAGYVAGAGWLAFCIAALYFWQLSDVHRVN